MTDNQNAYLLALADDGGGPNVGPTGLSYPLLESSRVAGTGDLGSGLYSLPVTPTQNVYHVPAPGVSPWLYVGVGLLALVLIVRA